MINDDINLFAHDHPKLAKIFDDEKNKLITKYPKLAKILHIHKRSNLEEISDSISGWSTRKKISFWEKFPRTAKFLHIEKPIELTVAEKFKKVFTKENMLNAGRIFLGLPPVITTKTKPKQQYNKSSMSYDERMKAWEGDKPKKSISNLFSKKYRESYVAKTNEWNKNKPKKSMLEVMKDKVNDVYGRMGKKKIIDYVESLDKNVDILVNGKAPLNPFATITPKNKKSQAHEKIPNNTLSRDEIAKQHVNQEKSKTDALGTNISDSLDKHTTELNKATKENITALQNTTNQAMSVINNTILNSTSSSASSSNSNGGSGGGGNASYDPNVANMLACNLA